MLAAVGFLKQIPQNPMRMSSWVLEATPVESLAPLSGVLRLKRDTSLRAVLVQAREKITGLVVSCCLVLRRRECRSRNKMKLMAGNTRSNRTRGVLRIPVG